MTGGLAVLVIAVPLTGVVADAVDGPSATISGTVFEDRDADDKIDAGEPGLAGVAVSDGQQIATTDAQGRYTFTTDVERRDVDLVFVTQPAGYDVGTDDTMTPRFFRNLGQLVDGDTREANFGLRKDKLSASGGFTFGNVADPHVNAQLPEQITEINSTKQDLAFIQVSGDLTNNATDAEFETYKRGTANSKVPRVAGRRQPRVLGGCDVRDPDQQLPQARRAGVVLVRLQRPALPGAGEQRRRAVRRAARVGQGRPGEER